MPRSVAKVWLQPFHPGDDVARVSAWLRRPHIVRWWGDPQTQLPAVLERPVGGADALIIADRVPVGYVRWQQTPRAELEAAGLHEIPDGSVDIDIAIGETDYIGCGVGSRALQLVVQRLGSEKSLPLVMMATSIDNASAIRAAEKAGFRRLRTFQDPEYGPCWLLACESPRPNTPLDAAPV
ncbi:MAG: GNAT family N-acetyltransferase [Planctomycetota bacterium]